MYEAAVWHILTCCEIMCKGPLILTVNVNVCIKFNVVPISSKNENGSEQYLCVLQFENFDVDVNLEKRKR